MSNAPFGLDADQVTATTKSLQGFLVNLIDLQMQTKQGHWNLHGARFRSLHLQLEEIYTALATHIDELAERIVTLGSAPDGRSATVASDSGLKAFPAGLVEGAAIVETMTERLGAVVQDARKRLPSLGDADPVSEDLTIGILAELEKQHWMMRSQADA